MPSTFQGHEKPEASIDVEGSYGTKAPNRFVAAAVRNPICNLGSMADTSDIPDWCYVGAYGSEGKSLLTEAPLVEHLHHFYNKSPISHISKVKTPIIFLLSAKDIRVLFSNGLQFTLMDLKLYGMHER